MYSHKRQNTTRLIFFFCETMLKLSKNVNQSKNSKALRQRSRTQRIQVTGLFPIMPGIFSHPKSLIIHYCSASSLTLR